MPCKHYDRKEQAGATVRPNTNDLVPPQSLESEQALLGCALKSDVAFNKIQAIIKSPDDFYAPRHQMIYSAMTALTRKSEPVDITTVTGLLQQRNQIDTVGGRVFLIDLVEFVASTANVSQYATVVRDRARLRGVIAKCNDTIASCYSGEADTRKVIDAWQQSAFEAGQDGAGKGFRAMADDNDAWIKRVDDLQSGVEQRRRVNTGFSTIDRLIHGMAPGELIIIAGPTGSGKTEFALQIAEDVAYEQGYAVGIVSLEMTLEEVNARVQCAKARVDSDIIETPHKLVQEQYNGLVEAAHNTREPMIFVDDSPLVTPAELMSNCRTLVANHGAKLIIVDYLQLVDIDSGAETREREIAQFVRSLKVMGKLLHVPVIALSQITPERGRDPHMGSFRESKAIGHTANTVFFTHRDPCKIIIGKSRRGPSDIDVFFEFLIGQWRDTEQERRRDADASRPEPYV